MSMSEVDRAFDEWLDAKTPKELAEFEALMASCEEEVEATRIKIVEDDDVPVKPKADKCKCKVCGFHKKAKRVNAEGICKTCYIALATIPPCTDLEDQSVVVVGRQGKKGRNTVSVMVGGQRVKVQRKVRIDAETEV